MRVALLVAALLAPALATAGTSQYGIINGEPIGSDVFPSALQIVLQGASNLTGGETTAQPSCTGTLIAPDVVLTAGHCVEDIPLTFGMFEADWYTFWVTFNADNSDMLQGASEPPAGSIQAVDWVQHPDWDMANLQNVQEGQLGRVDDIALIFLDAAIDDVPFSYLPTVEEGAAIAEDLVVDIVGYGQREVGSGNPFEPPAPGSSGVRYWAETFVNLVGDHELQIGDGLDTGRKCHGDSGGPTYAMIGTSGADQQRVIGVTSHALSAAEDCNVGGVDTRVDAYIDWIDDAMRQACADGLRVDCTYEGVPVPDAAPGDDDDAAADDDDDDDDDGGGRGGQGCQGCSTGGGASPAWLALGLVGLLRRRR